MRHLAQVQKNRGISGAVGLRLLARQDAEYMWAVTEEVVIPVEAIYDANNAHVLTEGLLTLVELSHLADS